MEKIEIWFSVQNGGDGSAYPQWFLTEQEAEKDQEVSIEETGEGWGESCTGMVETFVGSNIHVRAIENSERLINRIADLLLQENEDEDED